MSGVVVEALGGLERLKHNGSEKRITERHKGRHRFKKPFAKCTIDGWPF